jgi:hypothetical protein
MFNLLAALKSAQCFFPYFVLYIFQILSIFTKKI